MYIPKSFRLGCRTWKVKVVSDAKFRTIMHDIDKKWDYENPPRGLCDAYISTIYINADHRSDEDMLHTFWHEVVHAVLFSHGKFQNKDHDETLVDSWGDSLAQIMDSMKGENQLG